MTEWNALVESYLPLACKLAHERAGQVGRGGWGTSRATNLPLKGNGDVQGSSPICNVVSRSLHVLAEDLGVFLVSLYLVLRRLDVLALRDPTLRECLALLKQILAGQVQGDPLLADLFPSLRGHDVCHIPQHSAAGRTIRAGTWIESVTKRRRNLRGIEPYRQDVRSKNARSRGGGHRLTGQSAPTQDWVGH